MKFFCKNITLFFLILYTISGINAQGIYKYKIDLNKVEDDRLRIELEVPSSVSDDDVFYYFPKIVPGTYQIHNYGQVVQELNAFDNKGRKLYVERVDESSWRISKAKKLKKITYTVDDTWDSKLREPIYESAGTSFEVGNSFILNAQALFGYFKDKLNLKVELNIIHPENMYGATSLKRTDSNTSVDNFIAKNYHELIDSPILYCEPDTVNFKLGYGDLQIAVYSPNKALTSKELKKKIMPMLEAQNKYLGSILPVDRYNFLIYLSPKGFPSASRNALEHHRSSFYCLDEENIDKIGTLLVDLATHEFLHIVTPLHIKSEEIHNFDYQEPKMSRHLWLYEGVVEYMALHMQVRTGILTEQELLNKFSEKIRTSKFYKQGISLADNSNYCLIEPYSSQFNNFYNKGALTAMCLDLFLMQLSEGKYDLQYLLKDLSSFFGQDTPFKDDELFEKIIEITRHKDLLIFFSKYIEGTELLNLNGFLEPFGVSYKDTAIIMEISPLGGIENGVLRANSDGKMFVYKHENLDDFGANSIGLKKGDILLEWNGQNIDKDNISDVISGFAKKARENDILTIKVKRKNTSGKFEDTVLKTNITKIPVSLKDVLTLNPNPNAEQLRMRKIWLGPTEK